MFKEERREVAYFMRRLYKQKLTTTSGGNISLKIDNDNILITPSQLDKGRLNRKQIAITNIHGKNKTPELPLSMETGMHISIYKRRPEVNAIVHAHPAIASSFAVTRREINCRLLGEARAVIGTPVVAPYALMGTEELADIVSKASLKSEVVLMANHGVLTTGVSLLQAFDRIEVLEAAAKTTLITELLSEKRELNPNDLNDIDMLFS